MALYVLSATHSAIYITVMHHEALKKLLIV